MRLAVARWFGVAAVLGLAGVAFALLVAWSGFVNIAASVGHPAWLEAFLELGMRRSIERNSSDIVPPDDLASMDRIQLGAAHFAGGCAECHGSPEGARNPIYDNMLPIPPDLAISVGQWRPRELFFIVRHGLQFTGMPEWSGGERSDEVWSVVAFLLHLPTLNAAEYRELAAGNAGVPEVSDVATLREDGVEELARAACDRCHDTAEAAPRSSLVPRLAGQPAAFLERALREYRGGERRSGFMQPVVSQLSERQLEELAVHYSRMPVPPPATMTLAPDEAATAATIATGADPSVRLPACLSCHDGDSRVDYPRLQGQQAAYIAQQLRLFRNGGRRQSAWGEVMTVIAGRLDAEQIDLLAQWFPQQGAAVE